MLMYSSIDNKQYIFRKHRRDYLLKLDPFFTDGKTEVQWNQAH